jgi:hypothetical protein
MVYFSGYCAWLVRQRRENNGTGHGTPYQRCFGCLDLRYGERLVLAGVTFLLTQIY